MDPLTKHGSGRWLDSMRAARLVRRVLPFVAVGSAILLYTHFGVVKVPAGMDTMPRVAPPGSLCLIHKRPPALGVGSLVFVELPERDGGGTLLSRVSRVTDAGIEVEHSNSGSRLPSSAQFGMLPRAAVRGVVITVWPTGVDDSVGSPR